MNKKIYFSDFESFEDEIIKTLYEIRKNNFVFIWKRYTGIFMDSDGVYFIVDFGKESAGYLTLSIETEEGARVDIAHGEHLRDMRVRTKIWYRNFADTYI